MKHDQTIIANLPAPLRVYQAAKSILTVCGQQSISLRSAVYCLPPQPRKSRFPTTSDPCSQTVREQKQLQAV